MNVIKCIDISKHNGVVDFTKIKKSGINHVIIRAGYGFSNIDSQFYNNINNAIENGMHIGIYWFGYACNESHALAESQFLCKLLEKYKGKIDMPIFYDWEYDSYNYAKKQGVTATKTLVSNMTKVFCENLEKNGWFSGFYANIDYLNRFYNDDIKKRFTLWVAQWSIKCTYTGNYSIWQYTEKGKVDGITGNVDISNVLSDLSALITSKGFNGYSQKTIEDTSNYHYDVNNDNKIDKKDLDDLEKYLEDKQIIL